MNKTNLSKLTYIHSFYFIHYSASAMEPCLFIFHPSTSTNWHTMQALVIDYSFGHPQHKSMVMTYWKLITVI